MLPLLREILTEHKAASERTRPNDPVFVTATGTARSRHNLRQDVVDAAIAHAHRLVEERGMQQLGHTDPAFTLRVYSHAMRRSEDERAQLKALVEGHDQAQIGHKTAESTSAAVERNPA